jgi:hypothetical protein
MRNITLAVILGAITGCQPKHSDENRAYNQTRAFFRDYASALSTAIYAGYDLGSCTSVDEMLGALRKANIITDKQQSALRHDYWGRDYSFFVRKDDGVVVVRIITSGRNGIFEDGSGDDVTLEFKVNESTRETEYQILPKYTSAKK